MNNYQSAISPGIDHHNTSSKNNFSKMAGAMTTSKGNGAVETLSPKHGGANTLLGQQSKQSNMFNSNKEGS